MHHLQKVLSGVLFLVVVLMSEGKLLYITICATLRRPNAYGISPHPKMSGGLSLQAYH